LERKGFNKPILKFFNSLFTFLFLYFLQEWDTKAGEAKRQYEKAKKEYKDSVASGGGGAAAPSSSKK